LSREGFSAAEYRRRWRAVEDALAERGLDAAAVTYRLHVEYLTGTEGSQFWVAPVILSPSAEPTFLVREFEADKVRALGAVERVATYFDREDAVESWARTLRELGLADARLGLELDNLDLTHHDVAELTRLLPGLEIADISDVLPRLMAVKSEEEITAMRASARRTDAAVVAFRESLGAGVSEDDVYEAMRRAVIAAGSPELRGGPVFGSNSAIPHAEAEGVTLASGDVATTEASGYHLGYCAALCRSAVLGRNAEAEGLYEVARDAVEAAIGALLPGVTTGAVDGAARGVVEAAGRGASFRHRTGYANGLRANGRLNLSVKPHAADVVEAGMTFHLPVILFEPGRFSVGCSETVLVTATGAEPLSALTRDLMVI
jgi:Xaa-Pro aminopeptidase